jgi:3-oxoacyl-(acyl-carrier-protein) synthase
LDDLVRALSRSVIIYTDVTGHASSSNGFHLAAPSLKVTGQLHAMQLVLMETDRVPIKYSSRRLMVLIHNLRTSLKIIIAHKNIFIETSDKIVISPYKYMSGHAMGKFYSMKAVSSNLTLYEDRIKPTKKTPRPLILNVIWFMS